MNYKKLNIDWNAEPNAPEVSILVERDTVTLEFYLNDLKFDNVQEGDKGKLTFFRVHKYSFNSMNDEGYYMGQYRYKYTELPWGEFYQLDTEWKTDFPIEQEVLAKDIDEAKLKHYIFFFRDDTFECIAEDYKIEFLSVNQDKP